MVWLLALCASAFALTLTPEENARLDRGDVVIRSSPGDHAGTVHVFGVMDVAAPVDAVWAALLDWEGRMGANKSLVSVEPYRIGTDDHAWIRWETRQFGVTVAFYNTYEIDRASRTVEYDLDPEMKSDMVRNHGMYTLNVLANGETRIVYESDADFGRPVPGLVMSWLGGAGVRTFMEDLAARARHDRN